MTDILPVIIGIDPDLHCTGVAITQGTTLISAHVAKVPTQVKGDKVKGAAAVNAMALAVADLLGELNLRYDMAVIEGQQIYSGKTRKPESILLLAQVAGSCLSLAQFYANRCEVPLPRTWKGTVIKYIHQRRTFERLCIPCHLHDKPKDPNQWFCYPVDLTTHGLKRGEWKHVADGAGLALWGNAQLANAEARASALAAAGGLR